MTQEDFDWWDAAARRRSTSSTTTPACGPTRPRVPHRPPPGPEAAGLDPATRPDLNVGDGLGFLSRYAFDPRRSTGWPGPGCFGGFDTSDGGAADCLAMKGFARTTMTLAEGVEVDVYTLHAEAGGTATDQALQADDFDQLADFIEAHSAGPGRSSSAATPTSTPRATTPTRRARRTAGSGRRSSPAPAWSTPARPPSAARRRARSTRSRSATAAASRSRPPRTPSPATGSRRGRRRPQRPPAARGRARLAKGVGRRYRSRSATSRAA